MSVAPLAMLMFVLVALAAIAIAAAVSGLRPFDILRQSARLAPEIARLRPRIALSAVGFYSAQQIAPPVIVRYVSSNLFVTLALIVLVQAASVYALAHVAYRLHRGLIYAEWRPGLSWGRRERRMALYVLSGWALIGFISRAPALAPFRFTPAAALLVGAAVSVLALFVKVALALMGPAASLDDPAPLRRSIASAAREPAGVFAVVAIAQAMLTLVSLAFGLIDEWASGVAIAAYGVAALSVIAATYVFAVTELALVIALTRAWEDVYEPETRYAAHNAMWL